MTDTTLIERLDGPVKQAALDLIAAYFGTSNKVLAQIPANPKEDADLILCEGLGEAARALEAQQKRIDELEQHIADMIDDSGQECACGYDNPTDVCLGHKPMFDRMKKRIEELTEALEPFSCAHDYSTARPRGSQKRVGGGGGLRNPWLALQRCRGTGRGRVQR